MPRRNLSEALEIGERGGIRLHACDNAHLGWAGLDLQQADAAAAGKQWRWRGSL